MPTVTLHIKTSKNRETILSPRDLLDLYCYGITTRSIDGTVIADSTYSGFILFAQGEIEKYLGIKLKRQVIEEDNNFYKADIGRWTMMQTSYPVEEPISVEGHYAGQPQLVIPKGWLSSKMSSDGVHNRVIHLIPNSVGTLSAQPIVYGGMSPFLMMGNNEIVPNYWRMKYVTGYAKIPNELFDIVGKLAAINVFTMLGDILLGSGIASASIGIDGLSQSISTTTSPMYSGFGARVGQYIKELKERMPVLRDFYSGIRFTCV